MRLAGDAQQSVCKRQQSCREGRLTSRHSRLSAKFLHATEYLSALALGMLRIRHKQRSRDVQDLDIRLGAGTKGHAHQNSRNERLQHRHRCVQHSGGQTELGTLRKVSVSQITQGHGLATPRHGHMTRLGSRPLDCTCHIKDRGIKSFHKLFSTQQGLSSFGLSAGFQCWLPQQLRAALIAYATAKLTLSRYSDFPWTISQT